MKRLSITSFVIIASFLLNACGGGGNQAAASTPIPTVVAENVITAEGRLEPVHYADIAFNANGTVSEVLVSEGPESFRWR